MMQLAREGKQQGWWQSYELDYFAMYVGLEEDAMAIRSFKSSIVPGLLQTAEYARSIHDSGEPKYPPDKIDQLIQVRLTRQRALTKESPLQFEVVLDESVLRRVVGGNRAMSDQLQRIYDDSRRSNITIQIMPFTAGAHPAVESSFDIIEFGSVAPTVVYVEGLVGNMYLERPQDIDRYEKSFERLRGIALSPQDSIELIAEMAARYDRAATSGK